MKDLLTFINREKFREWLSEHCQSCEGVWLLFSKAKDSKTIKAEEALEEALCFGWSMLVHMLSKFHPEH